MKKHIILGLFSLALTATTALCGTISTVLVSTNQLVIPYSGAYAANRLVKLGNYTLPWTQAGKSSNIVATLPANIPAGTYALALQGSTTVSVEIGSVTAAAALNARVDAETARAGNAEAGLTNGINAEVTRAIAAETGLTNGINAETSRAMNAEADLASTINATSNNIAANFADNLNSISNGVVAGIANNFNTASNNIAAGLASYFNATSNGIVTSLTKNFMTAYSFGSHLVNAHTSVTFSSFIGDWSTNGTSFKIPATGVYQINFAISSCSSSTGDPYVLRSVTAIQITDSNDANTNGLGYFSFGNNYVSLTLSGQTIVQCTQGDLVSIDNVSFDGYIPITQFSGVFSYGVINPPYYNQPTNVPSATLSIIQIQ